MISRACEKSSSSDHDLFSHRERAGRRGSPQTYTDTAILTMATLQEVYHLTSRGAEGLTASAIGLLGSTLRVPDYTTLSRRRQTMKIVPPRRRRDEPLHVVVDSTGVKIYGGGEWKVRQHGYLRRRTWRKLHVWVDAATGEVAAAVVTTNSHTDGSVNSNSR